MSLVLLFYTILSPIFLLSFTALEIIVSLRPEYRNFSFHRYFRVQNIISLISFFLYNVLWRLNLYPEFSEFFLHMDANKGKWIHGFHFRPLLYLGVVHEFIHIFIAFDRFLAVIMSRTHKKARYWKHLFLLSMIVAFILPFAVTWQTFFNDVEFNKCQSSDGYSIVIPQMVTKAYEMNLSKNLALVLGLSMFISFVCYMFAYSAWRDKWNAHTITYEGKFLRQATIGFITTLPLTIHQIIFFVKEFNKLQFSEDMLIAMFQIMPWLLDIKYFASVHVVLFTAKSFRIECFDTAKRAAERGMACLSSPFKKLCGKATCSKRKINDIGARSP